MAVEAGSVFVRLGGVFDRKGFEQFEREHVKAQRAKDIETRLGGDFDRRSFDVYQRELDKVQARVKRRDAFKATLGGDYSPAAFRAYERDLARVERETERSQGRIGSAFKSVWGRGGAAFAAVGVAYGLGSAIRDIAGATVDFDRGMRNVNSIAQLSEGRLAALGKSVRDLAGKTAQSPQTLAAGLYDLVSSGFDAKQSMEILASSAKAATAGLTDTETSTKAVAAVLNAYHRPAKDAAAISDTLFQTVNLGVISFENLANNIGDVLPFAAQMHIDLGQVGAALSTMTKEGLSGEEATTRLKQSIVQFIKPSKDMEAAIKATGSSSGEALIKSKGFQGALEAVIRTTDGSKQSIAKLFPDVRGLGGALALTGSNARSAHKDLDNFAGSAGATDKALSQQAKSISYQWNKVKAQFEAVSIELGTKLAPDAIDALKAVGGFVDEMERGDGAGGRFVDKLQDARDTLADIVDVVKDNIHFIKVAAEAWVGYKAAAILARKASQWAPAPAVPGAPASGGKGGSKGPSVVGGWGSSVKGMAGATIVTTAGFEIAQQLARGPAGPDTGLLNKYADALERVVKAGDKAGMKKLAGQLRDTAQANADLTKGENLKRFADALDKTADSGGKDLGALAKAFSQLPQAAGPNLDKVRDQLAKLDKGHRHSASEVRDTNREIRGYWKKMADDGDVHLKDIRTSVTAYGKTIKRRLGEDTEEGKDALAKNFKAAARAVRDAMRDGQISTKTGLAYIRKYMAQALEQYGFSEQQAHNLAVHGVRETSTETGGMQRARGGWIKRAVGGWIGARGMVSDDVVPIAPGVIAAYGEYHATDSSGRGAVLNRHQAPIAEMALAAGGYGSLDSLPRSNALPILERAMAPLGGLDALFASVTRPHYLAGGGSYNIVPVPGFPGEQANASVVRMIVAIARRFGLTLTDAYGQGHKSPGHTQTGTAADFAGADRSMDAAVRWLVGQGYLVGYDGRFGSQSWPGHGPSYVAGGNAHLHVELGSHGSGGGLPTIRIRPPRISGGGTLGRVVQGGLNLVARGASRRANNIVDSALAMPVGGGGSRVASSYSGPLDHVFPRHSAGQPGVRLSPEQVMRIAGGAGLPARAFEQIAHGESDYQPGVVSSDGGWGLWQMTPRVWGSAALARLRQLGGIGQMLNPVKNALMARYLYEAAGRSFSPWYGTRYLTAAGGQGGIRRALGGWLGLAGGGRHRDDRGSVFSKDAPKRSGQVLEAMRKLWSAGSGFFPTRKSSAFPPVTFVDSPFVGVDQSNHSPTWGRMYWPPWMTSLFFGGDSNRSAAIQTIVHEWAHRFQDPAKMRSEWESEGGAQNFARKYAGRIARAAGFKYTSPDRGGRDDTYYGFAQRVRRVHGQDWFGFAGGGRTPRVTRSRRQSTTGGGQMSLPAVQGDRIARYDQLKKEIDGLDTGYRLWERRYNAEGGKTDLLNDDGTVDERAVAKQANYLRALIGIRSQIVEKYNEAQALVQRIIASYENVIDRLRRSLKHAKGKNRTGIKKQIDDLSGKLGTWRGNLDDLQSDLLPNAILDRQDIGSELNEVLGTKADIQDTSVGDLGSDTSDSTDTGTSADVDAILAQAQQRADNLAANLRSANDVIATFRGPGDIGIGGSSAFSSVWNESQAVGSQWPGSRAGTLTGSAGTATIVNNYNMPGHPEVLRAIGDAATAGQSLQPSVKSSVTVLGV